MSADLNLSKYLTSFEYYILKKTALVLTKIMFLYSKKCICSPKLPHKYNPKHLKGFQNKMNPSIMFKFQLHVINSLYFTPRCL